MNRNNLYRILHRLAPRVGAIAILSVACIAAACSSPERIRHSAIHFWDTTDMAGEDFAADAEERFVDFLELLQSDALNADERGVLLRKCFERAEADGRAFGTVCGLAEKYLDSFESPFYDEELYIHAIEAMIASRHITGHERLRPRYMWNMAQRNRTGDQATDLRCTLADGSVIDLYDIEAEHLLLFFSSPDCDICHKAVAEIVADAELGKAMADGKLQVVTYYSDLEEQKQLWLEHAGDYPAGWIVAYDEGAEVRYKGLYDLRTIPCYYLLDGQKRVLVKGSAALEPVADALRREVTVGSLQPERWWLDDPAHGVSTPLEERYGSMLEPRIYEAPACSPLLSDRGNMIWSRLPFSFTIRGGKIDVVESETDVFHLRGGSTLREVTNYAKQIFASPYCSEEEVLRQLEYTLGIYGNGEISFDELHEAAVKLCGDNYLLEEVHKSLISAEPVLRNMEYVFPGSGYGRMRSQFMLGDRLMVVCTAGMDQLLQTVRLPEGEWEGADGTRYHGPALIQLPPRTEYLPCFVRTSERDSKIQQNTKLQQ